ncbi:DUF3168 domain-containing protein [Fuscibacter oryzae]|uniref:DUF3168 domain-containing protein n=1 Tax=Fuscibacter oryzae TaxID=2803939 RepID=A0A8J7MQK6_9RHOB|nr:DUF3168 domain-containing protein [Fuscibacter oryzae]MBL4928003.1 DUF3168 domain-containing protein [Fuscibacter oryzae]
MIEPTLALQTAVRAVLITSPTIVQHIAPERIRAGAIRPEHMPSIVMTPGRVEVRGRASGGQIVAEVALMLHLWAVEDGSEVAQEIAGGVLAALMDAPPADGFAIDEWARPDLAWLSDPDPARSHTHAAIALRAVLRWRAE